MIQKQIQCIYWADKSVTLYWSYIKCSQQRESNNNNYVTLLFNNSNNAQLYMNRLLIAINGKHINLYYLHTWRILLHCCNFIVSANLSSTDQLTAYEMSMARVSMATWLHFRSHRKPALSGHMAVTEMFN